MSETFIVDGVRTPIGKLSGALSPVRPDDMAALCISELIKRNPSVDPEKIEDVILGCANQAGEDNRNVARMSALIAGLPSAVPGETVNRLCASGLAAAVRAGHAIRSGEGKLFIAGGVESMTRAPFVLSKGEQPFARNLELFDTSFGWRFVNNQLQEMYGTDSMGETAENLVERFGITREDQDRFAYNSQMKCSAAQKCGRFKEEIVPVSIPQRKGEPIVVSADEFPRGDTTLEALAGLRAVFRKEGSVTAGNSSGMNDGACAMLLASSDALNEFKLKPLARIVSSAVVGVEPRVMGIGPVEASRKALKRAELELDQIDLIELNEAFAAQSLACIRELGLPDDDQRINPNGGAIALGHPLGMSGARLLLTASLELEQTKKRYALVTLCVGVGQGMAVVIERAGS